LTKYDIQTGKIMANTRPDSTQMFHTSNGSAVTRSLSSKLNDIVSVFDFMSAAQIADVQAGTAAVDVTAAIQVAINQLQGTKNNRLWFPPGIYRCDSQLSITKPISITGDGCSAYMVPNDVSPIGTVFYFNHTGKGIVARENTGASFGAVYISGLGSLRNQPTPASGWVPTTNDFDISGESCHMEINDFTMINPTKGIDFLSTGYGRLTMNNIKGQPLKVGMQVRSSADTVKITNVHFWPFWQDNDFVHTYTKVNLDAILLYRCDNPFLANIFTIFARSGLTLAQNIYGTVSKIHVVNADFDRGLYGINIDGTVTSGVSGQFENITIQGETGLSGTTNVVISGNSSILQFGNLYTNTAQNNAFRIDGTNNRVAIANFRAAEWNLSLAGFPGIEATAGNIVRLGSIPTMYTSVGGPYFSATGTIKSPLGDGHSTASSDSSGNILIAHNLGTTPNFVRLQLISTAPLILVPIFITATTFTVRVMVSTTGSVLASTPIDFIWEASQ
jgi:Pectate lyase superfamily protein